MSRTFGSRLLEAVDAEIVLGALVLVGFGVLTDLEATAVAILLGIVVGVPFVRSVVDAEGESGSGLATVAFGVVVVAAGAYGYRLGDQLLGSVLALVGAWLVLDGVATRRYGDPGADGSTDEDLSRDEFARLHESNRVLVDELRVADRPLTATELASRTGLAERDVDRLLELHGDSGPIERVDGGYAIDERERGLVGFARYLGRAVGGRLLRPVRLYRSAT